MNTKEDLQQLMTSYQELAAMFKNGGKELMKDPEYAELFNRMQLMKTEIEAVVKQYKSSATKAEKGDGAGVASTEIKTPESSKKINASVGAGGVNQLEDVKLVQQLLNEKTKAGLSEDGSCGPKTIAAIKAFQQKTLGFADGRIDPGGKTWKALLGSAANTNVPVTPTENTNNTNANNNTNTNTDNTEEPANTDLYKLGGTVGKGADNKKTDVLLVQALLVRHGAAIGVDGDCGGKTIAAIEKFQQEKLGSKTGLVEPGSPTFKALMAKPANLPAGQEEIATGLGATGKLGNTIKNTGAYVISIPPNATGALPLVMLFSGLNQTATSLLNEVPDVYYLKAIMVFSAHSGEFSAAKGIFEPMLAAKGLSVASVSICGFSLGGQAAFRNYGHATKAVGLMDPTTYYKDLKKIDSKAVFAAYTRNGANIAYGWDWSGNKPGDASYTCQMARDEGIETAKAKGGVGEQAKMEHGKFPKYVLSKYKSKFI